MKTIRKDGGESADRRRAKGGARGSASSLQNTGFMGIMAEGGRVAHT